MARFVYHSKLPGNVTAITGFGAIIAFVVLAGLVRGPANRSVWFYIFFAVFIAAGILSLVLSRFIDMRTRRVHKVMPAGTDATGPKEGIAALQAEALQAKQTLGAMKWEIGPPGKRLFRQALGTLVFLILGAVVLALPSAWSRGPGGSWNAGAINVCLICCLMFPFLMWSAVIRFRIDGQTVTLTRPFSLFNRSVSFNLSEIDQVDITYGPSDAGPGKGLTIALLDGRRIQYGEADDVVDIVARQLRSAIEQSREVFHPLSDDAIR